LWQSRFVMETAPVAALVFLFGLAVGSFLNVCIRRIPAGASIVTPASRCPSCGTPIKPYDNIPVLSYLLLRGECRACGQRISPLYPAVELLTALLFLACLLNFELTLEGLKWTLLCCLILVLFFTDILERILHDKVNLLGLAVGLIFSLIVPIGDGSALWLSGKLFDFPPPVAVVSLVDAVLGATLISLPLWGFGAVFSRIIGRPALGFGDVKMMMMVGAFLGVKRTFLTLLAGTLLGSLIGLLAVVILFVAGWKGPVALRARRRGLGKSTAGLRWALARRYQLPLGTFLGVGAIFAVFYGTPVLEWYAHLFG